MPHPKSNGSHFFASDGGSCGFVPALPRGRNSDLSVVFFLWLLPIAPRIRLMVARACSIVHLHSWAIRLASVRFGASGNLRQSASAASRCVVFWVMLGLLGLACVIVTGEAASLELPVPVFRLAANDVFLAPVNRHLHAASAAQLARYVPPDFAEVGAGCHLRIALNRKLSQ
jgi:hypothetical protein